MNNTLPQHMNTLFHHGLTLIQKYEKLIQKEWVQMKQFVKHHGTNSAPSTIKAVEIFSKAIFNHEDDVGKVLEHLKTKWNKEIGSDCPSSPFIMTILENTIHQAIPSTPKNHPGTHHQAIRYFFLILNEHIHTYTNQNPFAMEYFLQHLVTSRQLPIEWIAIVTEKNTQYSLLHWFQKSHCKVMKENWVAESIFELSDILLHECNQSEAFNVLSIPFENKVLLFCTLKQDTNHIMPFIQFIIQMLQKGKQLIHQMKHAQKWMDAVLLFNESIIRAHTKETAIDAITLGFVQYLPFHRCAIFSYSKQEELAKGLSSHSWDDKVIQGITEEMENLPLIKHGMDFIQMLGQGMKYLQPLYIEDARHYFPGYYVEKFHLKSVVITPLYTASGNELIGAAILDQGENTSFSMTFDIYNALIHFGKNAGETLLRYRSTIFSPPLISAFSPRELEVLQLMSEGESTTSAAEKLHLSEYTVRDYITAIMQKMAARNRTEAVAQAIRQGII